ncbi:hypothetical protein [Fibrobacter sp. UWP2]|uniref:hypothetical protein n=1 Tax=Fibrobacter sp. UWP2 TaxID=1896216 RepID=UPI000915AA96|nr:hypothetical protein [Fibrobacter sp. UWP2]SHJ52690.1 hypothetical protein SAMN05720471_1572 [Fibrobacter sp. UWP2]
MSENKMTGSFVALTEEEMNKAFRYYNYVREFYGYLCDSLDLVFEDGCDEFDPAYAPAEKEFSETEGLDKSNPRAVANDKLSRAIAAYERMQEIVDLIDEAKCKEMEDRRGILQDTHKIALTSIAEWFPSSSLWREFGEASQKWLEKYADEAQGDMRIMEAGMLEDDIRRVFALQKECLEKFLPEKIQELKSLKDVIR